MRPDIPNSHQPIVEYLGYNPFKLGLLDKFRHRPRAKFVKGKATEV
jgi:hypothetical protein